MIRWIQDVHKCLTTIWQSWRPFGNVSYKKCSGHSRSGRYGSYATVNSWNGHLLEGCQLKRVYHTKISLQWEGGEGGKERERDSMTLCNEPRLQTWAISVTLSSMRKITAIHYLAVVHVHPVPGAKFDKGSAMFTAIRVPGGCGLYLWP
jgi:hypothetical protein